MRIYLGGIQVESNSFNPVLADCKFMKKDCWLKGKEILKLRKTKLEVSGIYDYCDSQKDVEIVPGFYTSSISCGKFDQHEFEKMTKELLESIENAGIIDGVILVLHGSMQSRDVDDCEGYIVRKVREIVGTDVPIVATFDYHAYMTSALVSNLDGAVGFMTFPHVDKDITGFRGAKCLISMIRSGIKPKKFLKRIPMIMSVANFQTDNSITSFITKKYRELINMTGYLSGGLFVIQPWLDVPNNGCVVCCFFEDEKQRSQFENIADEMLRYIWENRELFYIEMPELPDAIKMCKTMKKPVCLVDFSDVALAGSAGNCPAPLEALINADLDFYSCFMIADPKTVKLALEVGEGSEAVFYIGGTDDLKEYNHRIQVKAEVIKITNSSFTQIGPAQKGAVVNPGIRVLLKAGNVFTIVCQNVCMMHDRNMLLSMGLEPENFGIVVMKSTHSFIACWEGVMGSYIYADTPGLAPQNLSRLPFSNCGRPVYPLEKMDNEEFSDICQELYKS